MRPLALWQHGLLRLALPLPLAGGLVALYVWGACWYFADTELGGRAALGLVLGGLALFLAGFRLPRLLLRRLPAACPACGRPAWLRRRIRGEPAGGEYRCAACAGECNQPFDAGNFVAGFASAAGGIAGLLFVIFGERKTAGETAGVLLACLVFLGVGVGLAGGATLWGAIVARLPGLGRVPWRLLFAGVATCGMGALLIGAGLFAPENSAGDESAMPAGRAPVVASGCAFFLAGLFILLRLLAEWRGGAEGGGWAAARAALGLLIFLALLAVPLFIGLHDRGTPAAHPVPFLAAGFMILLLGAGTYLHFRRRKKD